MRKNKWQSKIYILFDGFTYNTRGYFASCVVFSRAPNLGNSLFYYKKILLTLFWPLFPCKSVEIHPALSVHQYMARANDVNNTESQ